MGAKTEYAVLDMLEKKKLDEIMNGGGGGGDFIVTISMDDSGEEPVYTADKTFAEIVDALESGMTAQAIVSIGGQSLYLPLASKIDDTVTFVLSAVGNSMSGTAIQTLTVVIADDDSVEFLTEMTPIGGGDFLVTISINESGEEPAIVSDKTFAEISEAIVGGAVPYATFEDAFIPILSYAPTEGVTFGMLIAGGTSGGVMSVMIQIDAEDNVQVDQSPVGGGNELVVTFTVNNNVMSADKTFSEISDALESGMTVRGDYISYGTHWRLDATYYSNTLVYFHGQYLPADNAPLMVFEVRYGDGNTIAYYSKTVGT